MSKAQGKFYFSVHHPFKSFSPVILWKKVEQIATEANSTDFVSSICPE